MKRLSGLFLLISFASSTALAGDRGTTQEKDTVRGAVMAPLEDINLKQSEIPAALVRAVANPYDIKGLTRCEPIAAEVGRLDAALGDDLDEVPPPDRRTLAQKAGQGAKGAAATVIRDETRSVIPFRSWVRKLSGAERRQKKVQAAIQAGGIRRGYLKGLGMNMNCAPPAAPSWYVPKVIVPKKEPTAWDRATAWWPWELKK